MNTLNYQEAGLAISDTEFAATLLVFGFKLKQNNPIHWTLEFATKEQYLAWRRARSVKANQPTEKATWNFEFDQRSQDLYKAFASKSADPALDGALAQLEPRQRAALSALIEAAIAQACHEALDQRRFLIRLLKTVPEDAKWILVRNEEGKVALFGVNASIETQTEHLSLL